MTSETSVENPFGITAGLNPADAAVRRAPVVGHRQFVGFLQRRVSNTEEVEEGLLAFVRRAVER